MAILKSKTTKYEFSLDDIKKLIAEDMKLPLAAIKVNYPISDTSDDRYGGSPNYQVTSIEVIVDETQLK